MENFQQNVSKRRKICLNLQNFFSFIPKICENEIKSECPAAMLSTINFPKLSKPILSLTDRIGNSANFYDSSVEWPS